LLFVNLDRRSLEFLPPYPKIQSNFLQQVKRRDPLLINYIPPAVR
jgi:hypothetical protein